jgi:hypothetical protein
MIFRIQSAMLIAATHGDAFTPRTGMLPQEYAGSFDDAEKIQQELWNKAQTWNVDQPSGDGAAEAAMLVAIKDLSGHLTQQVPGHSFEIPPDSKRYLPVYDPATGDVIGHDTITWLFRDGGNFTATFAETGKPRVEMHACVYIAVRGDPSMGKIDPKQR